MSYSSITSLPEGMQVERDLLFFALKNLKVRKGLMLCKTSFKSVSQLPLDLEVNKKLSEDFDIGALDDF